MGVVMIACPATGRAVSTGIETDQHSFDEFPDTLSKAKCPHCGGEHVWWTREAWLATDGDGDLPQLVVGRGLKGRRRVAR
jgi:hypothetical protein